jgi:uncharacterized integral membrane protein (TIGR00698 family)
MTDAAPQGIRARLSETPERLRAVAPGFAVSAIIAITAQFLAEHYGAPAMLMALLLGIAFHFLAEEGRCVEGVAVTSKTVLRVGVALLGARISVELLIGLGPLMIGLTIGGVIATILFGWGAARLLGRGWRLGLLTGGAVAICGASAAMAIAAVLPKNEHSERNLIFTVLGVTVLSTAAMIVYPILADAFGLDARGAGVFIGGTIHDVAQVVGAGFSISDEAGETATLVKLIRVAMLAPVVLVASLVVRRVAAPVAGARPPLLPAFVAGFLALATLNSLVALPETLLQAAAALSRAALVTAVAAVGMRTRLREVLGVGARAIALLCIETAFLGLFIAFALSL